MATLRNTNPLGAIELPLLAAFGRSTHLEPGEEFDVPDDVAADLLQQLGNYEAVAPAKAKTTTKSEG